jgi:rRNA maturation protein Nop10
MDPTTFEKIKLESLLEHCPSCGHAARFSKPDYRFLTG